MPSSPRSVIHSLDDWSGVPDTCLLFCGAQRVLLTGADYYETDAERAAMLASGKVPVGIGKNSYIE